MFLIAITAFRPTASSCCSPILNTRVRMLFYDRSGGFNFQETTRNTLTPSHTHTHSLPVKRNWMCCSPVCVCLFVWLWSWRGGNGFRTFCWKSKQVCTFTGGWKKQQLFTAALCGDMPVCAWRRGGGGICLHVNF